MFQVDPNAVLGIGSVCALVLIFLLQIGVFARKGDVDKQISELRLEVAKTYIPKDDVDKVLKDFKDDIHGQLTEIKAAINRLFDKVDEVMKK